MTKRRYRAALATGLVGLLVAGACTLWVQSYRRQEALNRQLIAALVMQDPKQALVLVNAGADPNTPVKPPSSPSLTDFWNHLIHRKAMRGNDSRNAFHIACGAYKDIHTTLGNIHWGLRTDEPHLVEMMLQHGAQKNAKEGGEATPLMWSILARNAKTMNVLLEHGVNVNAQDNGGSTALRWALSATFYATTPSERSKDVNIVRLLLAHGADPNLPDRYGINPLQVADDDRPDIVALLKTGRSEEVTPL